MNMLVPFIAGVTIGLFGSAVGLNGIALVIGATVIFGIVNDNLSQAISITLVTALAVALASGWVIATILIAIGLTIFYMHYGREHSFFTKK